MSIIQPTRRGFLLGLLAAPVIVKASSLMAVKSIAAAPPLLTVEHMTRVDFVSTIESVFLYDGSIWRITATGPVEEFRGLQVGDVWAARLAA